MVRGLIFPEYLKEMEGSVKYYDSKADSFETKYASRVEDIFQEFSSFLDHGSLVLDAGCGPGRDIKRFKDSGFNPIGIDLNPKFVEKASKHGTAYLADMLNLSFPDSYFDALWVCASLVHMHYSIAEIALSELFRVSRRGSWSYFSVKTSFDESSFSRWTEDRYFYCWKVNHFVNVLERNHFDVSEHWLDGDFLNVYARAR